MVTPPGFKEAFHAYAEGGWIGIAAPEAYGGQGLPEVVALAAFEPVSSANMGFGLCPLLTQDAILLLETHGTDEQKARLLPPMVEGRWTGTMCLTEPSAGSDLAGVRTRAQPDGDGYRITGEKIFITYGDHELDREHPAHGARPAARRARPAAPASACSRCRNSCPTAAATRRARCRWSTSSASMPARPR